MPTETPNIKLEKPIGSEKYDIDKLNANFDKIDTALVPSSTKTTLVNGDIFNTIDSQDLNKRKKITWANIKATLKTYFDTLYNLYTHPTSDGNLHAPATSTTNDNKILKAGATAGSISWSDIGLVVNGLTNKATPLDADSVLIVDSASANVGKKTTWANIKEALKTHFDGIYATITNLNLKAPIANPTFTGTQTLPSIITNGIKFPATQIPSSDPNTFDDYEEGTFSLTATASGGTITQYVGTGDYVKIGKEVTVAIRVQFQNIGTATGLITVSGLPFVSSTTSIGCVVAGQELNNTGFLLYGQVNSTLLSSIRKYDGTGVIQTNMVYKFLFTYITQ